jgi:DNA-binding LytR/AlgR family response regulator
MRCTPAPLGPVIDDLAHVPPNSGRHLRWINASRGEDVQLITMDEVRYFHSDTKYTRVVAARAEGLIRMSIKQLVEELDPSMFWQIHRATIVNLTAIERVAHDLRGGLVLRLKDRKEVLPVSQPYAHLFRRM